MWKQKYDEILEQIGIQVLQAVLVCIEVQV